MHVKCAKLRSLFVVECECVGAKLCANFEEAIRNGVPTHHSYKHNTLEEYKKSFMCRGFGGISVFLVGGFYQLPPVSATPIMSNPATTTGREDALSQSIMNRVWACVDDEYPGALQRWSEAYCSTAEA